MHFTEVTEDNGRKRLINLSHVNDILPFAGNPNVSTRIYFRPDGSLDVKETYEEMQERIVHLQKK